MASSATYQFQIEHCAQESSLNRQRNHSDKGIPEWKLPPGVSRGTWDYFHHRPMARDYDAYHAHNRLFEFDEQVIIDRFDPSRSPGGSLVADLGCGSGRAIVSLAERGFRGLAIDLSEHMLREVRRKAERRQLPIECVRANLVELDIVAENSVDYAISLFSTMGMIKGRSNRDRALAHVRRILRPGGLFVIHVHNYWYNLYDPGGPWWLFKNLIQAKIRRDIEVGDKYFFYRGVPNMFLHVFRPAEHRADLKKAGFTIREWIPLAAERYRPLACPWFLSSLRANGWIAICE